MNKELQKLLKQINDKKNEVKSLVNDGKLDKAKAAKEELKELQNRFDPFMIWTRTSRTTSRIRSTKALQNRLAGRKRLIKRTL